MRNKAKIRLCKSGKTTSHKGPFTKLVDMTKMENINCTNFKRCETCGAVIG